MIFTVNTITVIGRNRTTWNLNRGWSMWDWSISKCWGASLCATCTNFTCLVLQRLQRSGWCCTHECKSGCLLCLYSSCPFMEWCSDIFRNNSSLVPRTHLCNDNIEWERDKATPALGDDPKYQTDNKELAIVHETRSFLNFPQWPNECCHLKCILKWYKLNQ